MRFSTRSVDLQGDAIGGIFPIAAAVLARLGNRVRLGRIRPAALPAVPRFRAFWDPQRMTAKPPDSINRRQYAMESLQRMYMNDQLGCCVMSGKAHNIGLWSGADQEVKTVLATDQEIKQQYQQVCGPGDRGCQITSVLDYCRSTGFLATGQRYKIDGYVAGDNKDRVEVQTIQYLFGAGTFGINLPDEWTKKSIWDVTTSRIVGGHDVSPIDYDGQGVYVSSWGRVYLMTWAAVMHPKWVEEYYAILGQLWYGSDRMSPSGVDVTGLKKAMQDLAHGELPDLPDVDEPPEPPGPGPGPGPGTDQNVMTVRTFDGDGKPVATYDRRTGN